MPTTPKGLPYPDSDGFVIDGAAAIEALADAVDDQLDDYLPVGGTAVEATHAASADNATNAATVGGKFESDFVHRLDVARGTVNGPGATAGTGYTQAFGVTFGAAPCIAVGIRQPGAEVAITASTTTGFTWEFSAPTSATTPLFDWIALL